jgi:hypothetical protein
MANPEKTTFKSTHAQTMNKISPSQPEVPIDTASTASMLEKCNWNPELSREQLCCLANLTSEQHRI